MRQIKPSVLSTIMNYIYEQESSIQSNIVNSLKDLPYLIFEFSNYKPVKSRVKIEDDEEIKAKINFIFSLINSANNTYQNLKIANRNQKHKKSHHLVVTSHEDDQVKKEKSEEIDFIKYLPKKTYTSHQAHSLAEVAVSMSPQKKTHKEKQHRHYKRAEYSEIKAEEYPRQEKDLLQTDLIQDHMVEHNPQFLIKKQEQEREYFYHQNSSHKKEDYSSQLQELGALRQRRISLEAHEQFMEEDIGDLDQPSQISGFYCPGGGLNSMGLGLDDLVIVGRQVVLHQNPQVEVKVEPISSHENIDQLIEINYSN